MLVCFFFVFCKYANFLILTGGHYINKMSFEPTLFSQNYPEDPVGKV